jgi:hypothetical protein
VNVPFKWVLGFQVLLYLVLSFSLYFLFIINIPLFEETHGLLALNEWSDLSMSVWIKGLIALSAVLVSVLGTLLVGWIPSLPSGVIGNLWTLTFFFLWLDTATALTREAHSLSYLCVLVLGVLWVRLYFHFLGVCNFGEDEKIGEIKVTQVWVSQGVWGWMGFYFGLSSLLLYQSLRFMGQRIPLALGAYFLCFLNYLLVLHLRKISGGKIEGFSKAARWFFSTWMGLLIFGLVFSILRR